MPKKLFAKRVLRNRNEEENWSTLRKITKMSRIKLMAKVRGRGKLSSIQMPQNLIDQNGDAPNSSQSEDLSMFKRNLTRPEEGANCVDTNLQGARYLIFHDEKDRKRFQPMTGMPATYGGKGWPASGGKAPRPNLSQIHQTNRLKSKGILLARSHLDQGQMNHRKPPLDHERASGMEGVLEDGPAMEKGRVNQRRARESKHAEVENGIGIPAASVTFLYIFLKNT